VDLSKQLSTLISLASSWAEIQSNNILRFGIGLNENQLELARIVGVQKPDQIRVMLIRKIPVPEDEILRTVCKQLNFLGPDTEGLTLYYGIFIKKGLQLNRKLLAHEFRHVAQYEQHPSITSYLSIYIPELLKYGYTNAPLEVDAERASNLSFKL
jgi:hypothetical protein